jgi:ACS family glucarate transporter-like MFS transporter
MHWPPRYSILFLLFLLSLVNYIDRVNISLTAPVMMPELGWDTAWFGVVFSAFVAGYAICMIPSGLLADTRSPKMLLAAACFGWSLFTLLTPLGQYSFVLMLTMRFLVGAFEATSLPTATVINSRWVPKHELGIAQMISLSGIYAGQLIAYPISTWIVKTFSWHSVFYFNGIVGFLWIALWLWKGADRPAEADSAQKEAVSEKAKVPIGSLLSTPAVLALSLAYFFWAYGLTMVVAWLPTYLVKARGFTMQEMGWVGMLPVTGGLIGVLGGGVASDWLVKQGVNRSWARKGLPATMIACSAPFLAIAVSLESPMHAVFAFAVFQLLTTLGLVAFWSIPVEMNARLAGSIASIMNFGGNFGGFFSPMVAGYIVQQTNDWSLPYYSGAAGCLLGAVILGLCVPVRAIEMAQDDSPRKSSQSRVVTH